MGFCTYDVVVAYRSSARGVRHLGIVPLAFRRAVLYAEDVADRNDRIGLHPYDCRLYRRTLHCNLPPIARPLPFTSFEVGYRNSLSFFSRFQPL